MKCKDGALTQTGEDGRSRVAIIMLAGSLISVELLAGMQRYLSQTVLPLLADELNGAGLYGILDAAAQAPMFLTMPIGAWLLSKFDIRRLLFILTGVSILGSAICAVAPTMWVFIGGTVVRALAAGALSTVSMGAISKGLPPRYRQLVLAGMSGVWVLSSVLGPVYAVAVSNALSWRWAMVIYLPLLVIARFLIGRFMPPQSRGEAREGAPWRWATMLAVGSLVLALPAGKWSPIAVFLGGGLMFAAARELLPRGTFSARLGRRASVHALTIVAVVYFGATMVLSVVAHDAFGLQAEQFGFIIAAPGFCWAIAGLWTGSHPATANTFRRRAFAGGTGIAAGLTLLALAVNLIRSDDATIFVGLLIGAALMGFGMGWLYPDLLGRCLSQPDHDDGITADQMAGAVVLSETVGMSVATTAAYSWLATGFGTVSDQLLRVQVLYIFLAPIAILMLYRLAKSSVNADAVH